MTGVTFIDVSSKGIEAAAAGISELRVEPLEGPSRFIKPQSVRFQHQQRMRRWDMVASHPSVSVVLYHTELKALLLVRQFRPAVYAAAAAAEAAGLGLGFSSRLSRALDPTPPPLSIAVGFTYELCAGIVDKPDLSLEAIAKEEVLEEVGYTVGALQKIGSAVGAVGISGALQTYYFGEVDESMRNHSGGGNTIEGEEIDVVGLPIDQIDQFVADNSLAKPPGVLFGALWLKNHLGSR